MKKTLTTVFGLALLALLLFIPLRAKADTITPDIVTERVQALKSLAGDYFNYDGTYHACGGGSAYSYSHTCANCKLSAILSGSFIGQRHPGITLTPAMLDATGNEYGSRAFAHYAAWYIYREENLENSQQRVDWSTVFTEIACSFNNVARYAQLGDVIYLKNYFATGYHYWGIITDFSSTGMTLVGCGFAGPYNNRISVNTISFNSAQSIDIYRAYPAAASAPIKIGWPDRSYRINYNSNGGTGSMLGHTVGYMGGVLTLRENTFTKEGHTFSGWTRYRSDGKYYTSKGWLTTAEMAAQNVTATVYADRASFSYGVDPYWIADCASKNVTFTFYAYWKQTSPLCTISFSSNGGKGSMSSFTKYGGATFTLPANTFTRENYNFRYWMLKRADGKWYVQGHGFYTIAELNSNGWGRTAFSDTASVTMSSDWFTDYTGEKTYTFVAQWRETDVVRLYGSTRYDTAIAIADRWKTVRNMTSFPALVLASGENAPDALSGSYLAHSNNCPLLITSPAKASKMNTYITQNLRAGATIYVLGGDLAMPKSTYSALQSAGYKIKILAGKTRYDTNLAILKELGKPTKLTVCTGQNYADALAASALEAPILLVGSSLTSAQKTYLNSLGGNVSFTILGGPKVVPTSIYTALKSYGTVRRVYGNTRYDTAVKVAQQCYDYDYPYRAIVTVGNNFPDSLCAGPLAMWLGAPILLVKGVLDKPTEYAAAAAFLQSEGTTHGYVCGSSRLITDAAVRQLFKGSN